MGLGEGRGRPEIRPLKSPIPPAPPFVTPQPMFSSRASGSGYQLFNYFQIVEFRSGLNKSH